VLLLIVITPDTDSIAGVPHIVVIEATETTNCPSARVRMSDHKVIRLGHTHTRDHTVCGSVVSGSNVLLPSAPGSLEMTLCGRNSN
jgi:hypothetical protein